MSRFACVRVAAFRAAALERCEPALRERPLAVVSGTAPATRVLAVNAAAWARGVVSGLTGAEASARCGDLVTRAVSVEAEAAARHALLEASLAVSPRVEDAGPGLVHVDVTGLGRLIGDDAAIARRLVRHAGAAGLEARVAVAGTRAAADVVASVTPGVRIVPAGAEAVTLAPVPLAALTWPEGLAPAFARWGLRTLGDLAALPRTGLGARLGAAGLAAHDLARGVDRTPFRPWTPPPSWEEAQGLEWEIHTLPALRPVLERVLARLTARLAAAHLAADVLDLRLRLVSGGHHARTLALALPTIDAGPMLTLLALDLEAHPPPAAVIGVAVAARVLPWRAVPAGLWEPPAPAARDLAAVLARLATLVGPANVGAPVALDSHRPDAHALAAFGAGSSDETPRRGLDPGTTASAAEEPVLALRRVRPPCPLEVDTTREGTPARLREASGRDVRVVALAGPWRVSGEWWDADAWSRDEWDVALADGRLCRLAHDHLTHTWLLDAIYD